MAFQIDQRQKHERELLVRDYQAAEMDAVMTQRFSDAITLGQRVIAIDPKNIGAMLSLVWACHGAHQDSKALLYAEKALALAPEDMECLSARSAAYSELGMYDLASQDQLKLITRRYIGAYSALANIRLKEHRFGEALALLDHTDGPGFGSTAFLKAKAYEGLGQHDRAVGVYKREIQRFAGEIFLVEATAKHESLPYRWVTGQVLCQEYRGRAEAAEAAGDDELALADRAHIRWIESHSRPYRPSGQF